MFTFASAKPALTIKKAQASAISQPGLVHASNQLWRKLRFKAQFQC